MQNLLRVLYPPQCVSCGDLVEEAGGLCGPCWQQTAFLGGLVCDVCGQPLIGEARGGTEICDDCMTLARPWGRGRAALLYRDNARRLVLALKHGDRLDLVVPAARWMAKAAEPIVADGMIAVPVPAHRLRLLRRRYNQAAELAREVARLLSIEVAPDALIRVRRTRLQDGLDRDHRFANLEASIRPNPRRSGVIADRHVLLIDDVMTSGATLAAASEAARAAGARDISVLVLARVAKDA